MQLGKTWRRLLFVGVLGLFVVLGGAACGDDDSSASASDSGSSGTTSTSSGSGVSTPSTTGGTTSQTTTTSGGTMMELEGTIEIDGSSTVAPISEAVAEEFLALYPDVRVNVGISGTGGGFKRFTVGETEISDASRPIKDTEAVAAAENGIQWVELTVALDGLAVMVSTQNDFVNCLTVAELNEIWKPDSTVDSWDDVRSSFPNEPINLYGPDTESGTFDYFTDVVNGDEGVSRSNYVASSDDNVLVRGIAGDRNSLGYFGYAYYAEYASQLKLVAVDGGNGCVEPSDETVADGSYAPLARPIFIYVDVNKLRLRPELKLFVDYYLDNLPRLVPEVGYTALPNYDEEKGKLAKAYTGA